MHDELKGYRPSEMAAWSGRVDAVEPRDALRWHQVVQRIDLGWAAPAARRGGTGFGFCLLGYRCDAGVARNLGRTGASKGPQSIRRQLANLPVCFSDAVTVFDGGDVHCPGDDVEAAQHVLAGVIERALRRGLFPVVLGGGHDLEFGHWLGTSSAVPAETRLGIVSFDAHFDLRPADGGANSGTSFAQIAQHAERTQRPFHYLCLGVQRSANTVRLFRTAERLGVEHVLARDIVEPRLDEVRGRIDRFLGGVDAAIVTVDADVMSSAFAPGVSAPQPLGLDPETVLRLLKHVLASGKVASFDVAEVSPRFDSDNNTAKVAAIFIYALVEALTPEAERIL